MFTFSSVIADGCCPMFKFTPDWSWFGAFECLGDRRGCGNIFIIVSATCNAPDRLLARAVVSPGRSGIIAPIDGAMKFVAVFTSSLEFGGSFWPPPRRFRRSFSQVIDRKCSICFFRNVRLECSELLFKSSSQELAKEAFLLINFISWNLFWYKRTCNMNLSWERKKTLKMFKWSIMRSGNFYGNS